MAARGRELPGVLLGIPDLVCNGLTEMRGKQLGHFEHSDLILNKYGFELRVGVNVALICSVLQVVALMYSHIFFVTSVRGMASPPMMAASSAEGVSALLKPVAAPAVFAGGAFLTAGDFFAAVAMDSPIELV
jgi:hypothetical protein